MKASVCVSSTRMVKTEVIMHPFYLKYFPFDGEYRLLHDNGVFGFLIHLYDGCEEGSYHILIDSTATLEQQSRVLRHELSHLVLGHVTKTKTLSQINSFGSDMFGEGWEQREKECDDYADQMTDEEFEYLMAFQIGRG